MAESGFFDALADEASQEDFLRRELSGSAPQYDPEGGLNTAKNIGRMAAEMTLPGAAASAAGYMGEPSTFQNIGSGDYGTAALQAAGLIPGIGWMGKAGRLGKGARRASEVIPPSAAREVGATPRGWDIAGPREVGRTIEGNVAVEPYLIGGEGAPAPRRAVNYTSEVPLPRYTDYGPKISTELNPQIADLLRSIRAEGRAPNRFESNMLSSYFRGQQGSAAAEAMANMPVSVIPRGVQRALNNIRAEGREPTKLELLNMKKHFAGRTGLKSRAALDRVSMGEELAGPYPEFRGAIREEMAAAPEELAASEGTRESLINRALNIASRVGPRVAEGMAVGAPAGMATGLAYNAMMNRGDMPVVPIANREERPVIAPMQLREFPMSTAMGTDFESVPSVASDMPQETALPPRRPSVPRHAAPIHRSAPRHVGPSRMVDSGKRYYGDWRDAEPYASDPIGGFIDELTGRTRTARRPGRAAPSSAGLGDLLPFASGGTVRRPFANGGAENRIPVLSDIGDALGGMMQGGEEPVVASDRSAAPEGRENIFERWSNNPLSQYLFAAGLGMMASPQANPLMAVGEGGLRGLEYMQAVQANADMRRREREAAAERRREAEEFRRASIGNSGEIEEQTPSVLPSKTASTKIPDSEGSKPVDVAQSGESLQNVPESATQSAPIAQPVVANDDELRRLNDAQKRFEPFLRSQLPEYRKAAEIKIRQIENAKQALERKREKAIQDARYQEQLNLQKSAQERKAYESSKAGITEKVRTEQGAKKVAEDELETADIIASLNTLDQMEDFVKKGIYSGIGAETMGYLGKQGPGSYVLDKGKADRTNEFIRLGNEMTYLAADKKLNAGTSNADVQFLRTKGPNVGLSAEGNRMAIQYMKKALERKQQIIEKEQEYIDKHGALDSKFYKELKDWGEKNRLFAEEESEKQTRSLYEEGKIYPRGGKQYQYKNGKMYEVKQ